MDSRKRKRVSKNKKKNWRKHTDIADVEEYLEDKRLQERTGGLVADKPDDELFFVDKVTAKDTNDEPAPAKKKKIEKPLRCHASLLPDPKIKPAKESKNNRTAPPKIPKSVADRKAKGLKTAKEIKADEDRQKSQQLNINKRRQRNQVKEATYDLWSSEPALEAETGKDHFLKVTKRKPVKKPPLFHKKPSEVAAVEVPHPGASYNPTYEDHQELLSAANQVEVKKDTEEKRIIRALDEKFPTRDQPSVEELYLQEMSVGINQNKEEDQSESEEEEEAEVDEERESLSVNPPVRREDKKTLQQKRKDKERKEGDKKMKQEKDDKQKEKQMYRLKTLKKEVADRLNELDQKANKRQKLKERKQQKTKKLGKLKFEPGELEIKLSDELEGSLRLMKPEGNLIEDRFKSLQKRNIIEPRLRAKVKRKYKPKVFEKKGHKAIVVT